MLINFYVSNANGCKQLPRGQNMNYGDTVRLKISVRLFVAEVAKTHNQFTQLSLLWGAPLFDAELCCGRQYSEGAPVLHFAKGIFIKNVWQRVHSCKISQHKLARVFAVWPARSFGTPSTPIVFIFVSRAANQQPDGNVRHSHHACDIIHLREYHFVDFALMLINEFALSQNVSSACAGASFQNNLSL